MGTYNRQYAKTPLQSDLSCINLSVTDIPSDTVVVMDTTAADLVPLQDGYAVALPATGGNPGIGWGVTQEIIRANGALAGRLRTQGIAYATCDGAVTIGTIVDVSVTTAGRVKAHTSGKQSFAMALETGADGDVILLMLGYNAPNA